MSAAPTLRHERRLLRDGATVLACLDEVGRGALCGPVTVGAVAITASTKTAPQGVRDSKLLSPTARQALVPKIQRWAPAWGVGHASPAEIDAHGIIWALRAAGRRALAQLDVPVDCVLLDGNHDYLSSPPQETLFDEVAPMPRVVTQVKADMTCAAVAAASVLAKTARDALILELAPSFPAYGWARNKGYAAADHLDALRRFGPTPHHRVSWNLPGTTKVGAALSSSGTTMSGAVDGKTGELQ